MSLAEQNEKLENICEKLEDIKGHLDQLNGRVIKNREDVIKLSTWRSFYTILTPILFGVVCSLITYELTK